MPTKQYVSYIRVSTLRQGQTGTSLEEQRAAIQRYAARFGLAITEEYEEKETAAAQGRPVFNRMLKALRQGEAAGVIMHKIDRSARNLKDWAELGELNDRGIEIHFANESIDLHSRGGRLSADIQAVVAADFIRNLREETRKGFYGRLKQGLYPRPAPPGYQDCGKGNPKEPDAVQAPLVKQAFELYATGNWPLNALVEKMYTLGLRNKTNQKITRNGLSKLLHNRFYIGLIVVAVKGEIFLGQHRPIVSKKLFERVQDMLAGKNIEKKQKHVMLFRKLLKCKLCGEALIGERQKGHVYYRCHRKACPQKTIREETVENAIGIILRELRFTPAENRVIRTITKQSYDSFAEFRATQTKALHLQLEQLQVRLGKLTDAYIDGVIEKEIYLHKKNSLIVEEQEIRETLQRVDDGEKKILRQIEEFLELVNNAYLSWKAATPEEKREIVKTVTSNLVVQEKTVIVKLHYPFQIVLDRQKTLDGSPHRAVPRTLFALISQLHSYFEQNQVGAFSPPMLIKVAVQ